MHSSQSTILAVATQKGGTGKSTTAVNLAHAFALSGKKILVVDMDPQGNASNSLGFKTKDQGISIADLIWDKSVPVQSAINKRTGMDVIIANTNLARVERGMLTMVNSELRLAQRLREVRSAYDYIIIDSTPSYGPLLNSVLNVADQLVVPVDSNYFALMGIQKLLGEVEETLNDVFGENIPEKIAERLAGLIRKQTEYLCRVQQKRTGVLRPGKTARDKESGAHARHEDSRRARAVLQANVATSNGSGGGKGNGKEGGKKK